MEKKVWSTIYEKEADPEEFQHIGELRPPVWSTIYEKTIDTEKFRYTVGVYDTKEGKCFRIMQQHLCPGWVGDGYIRANIFVVPELQSSLLPAIAEAIECCINS